MKKVLITGGNSYIGQCFEKWVENYREEFHVDTLSLHGDEWKDKSFIQYHSILHVAGIVHKKETKKNKALYYLVNRDLAIQVAEKARSQGVSQFVLLSSMSVYGKSCSVITKNTETKPDSHYGISKLQAEKAISKLETEAFHVAIVRPPMVYGSNCKGNYQRLSKLAKCIPVFPDISNQRSMLYINNLSEFLRLLMISGNGGIYYPQNKEYVCTSKLVRLIANAANHRMTQIKLLNWLILHTKNRSLNKMFGNLIYEKDLSNHFKGRYQVISFRQSIKEIEA